MQPISIQTDWELVETTLAWLLQYVEVTAQLS